MATLFWICFLIGVLYTIVVVIFGDVIASAVDASLEWLQLDNLPIIQPLTLIGGLSIFGGAGILLQNYTALTAISIIMLSLSIGIVGMILLYFLYLKPMENAENSIGYSIKELVGKEAIVVTPIPIEGFGEVMIKTVGGMINHIAASYDNQYIAAENHVVVVEVVDGVLHVAEFRL